MQLILTKEEQLNTTIKFLGKRSLSNEYSLEREIHWEEHLKKGESVGKKFWNGLLYSFEGFDQFNFDNPVLYLGEMEYKDYIFKKKVGVEYIVNKYGKEYIFRNCGVDLLLVTKDKKIVIGQKAFSVNLETNLYGHISGNMNIDEMIVGSFSDISNVMKMEIEEESNIKFDSKRLNFNQIILFNSYVGFEYIYQLDISSQDVHTIFKTGEFTSFTTVTPEEFLKLKGVSGFEFSKRYIKDII